MNRWMMAAGGMITLAFTGVALAQQAQPALTYAADGKMVQPKDCRTWIYLSTGFDMSYAEGASGAAHSFDNVFVNREAYDGFLKTGAWPDKTVMVLEVRGTGGENPLNKKGEFQGDARGMEVHVKDASKGGWAFYGFGKDGAPATAMAKTASCYACHQDHGAVDTTFVQFYPTLRSKIPAGAPQWADMPGPLIETERLILRPYVEADFDGLHAIWSDPQNVRFITAGPSLPQQSWFRLLRAAGMWSVKGFGSFAILDKMDGRFLGEAGFGDWRREFGDSFDPFPEAGWLLARDVHGRGLATEAVMAVHGWLDESRPGTRSVCIIDADNAPSLRIADRAGYRSFGRNRIGDNEVIMFERLPVRT